MNEFEPCDDDLQKLSDDLNSALEAKTLGNTSKIGHGRTVTENYKRELTCLKKS
jgi:hypothetical protein